MSNEYHGNIMIYLWMKCEDLIDLDTYYDEMGGWLNIANLNGEPKHIDILHVFDDLFLSTKQSFLRFNPFWVLSNGDASENPQLHLQNQTEPI